MRLLPRLPFLSYMLLTVLFACDHSVPGTAQSASMSDTLIDKVLQVEPLKKSTVKRQLSSTILKPADPDTLPYLPFDPLMLQAMYEQANYLQRKDVKPVGASGITKEEMVHTVELLQDVQLLQPEALRDRFDFYRVKTSDSDDRVRITGYYTPILKASKKRTSAFPVPLYKRPKKNVPNPASIEAGALKGRGLEICYVASKKELKNAQLQGSCLVEYPDGHREFLGFGGSVRGTGGTYVFFTPIGDRVLGSGSFPLTAGYSIAVDPRYIPIGSTFLIELPDIDAAGKLKGKTYRIVFAQDRGGAIQTTKRIDMYCGIGLKGLQEARKINRYGRMWLLLPKQ